MSYVVCKLPRAGLGNQLFPLMHAAVFAELNQLPLIIIGYHQLKIGPYLRREKTKRKYSRYFTFQQNIIIEKINSLRVELMKRKYVVIKECEVEILSEDSRKNKLFLFENMPHYLLHFEKLKPHRDKVIRNFMKFLRPWILEMVSKSKKPVIGVHVRKGDFRKLSDGEIFRGGHVRTPEQYFVSIIENIRRINGNKLPATIFTDGYPGDFEELLNMQEVSIAESKPDIVDMLLLSKSKIIIASSGSTFSYWAGFLSDAPLVMHPESIHKSIRPEVNEKEYYEGQFSPDNILLTKSIRNIC